MLIAVGNLDETGWIENEEREREKIKTETNDTLCFVVKLFFSCTCLPLFCLFAFVAVNLVRSLRRERECKRKKKSSASKTCAENNPFSKRFKIYYKNFGQLFFRVQHFRQRLMSSLSTANLVFILDIHICQCSMCCCYCC